MFSSTGRRTRAVLGGFAAALALSLASCSGGGGGDDEPDFGTNDPSVVVALGDSITFGVRDTGIDDCSESLRGRAGFPARLGGMSGKTVLNRGICGADSYAGVGDIELVLDRYHPSVILIDYSPNDLFNGTEVLISNLRTMVLAARNNKTVPILGTLLPAVGDHKGWMTFIRAANEKILELCREEKIECADHFKAFLDDPLFQASPYALLDGDGFHPNAAGYQVMADTWLEPLKKAY